MKPIAILTALSSAVLLQPVSAACSASTTQQYNQNTNYGGPNACVPSGYSQAQDLGQTTQADLMSRCRAQCANYGSQCQAYVGQLHKAADSNLMTGQCYYYSSLPNNPVRCADYPSTILAESKDTSLQCLQGPASASQAAAFCSSYLSIGTRTVYTSTVTPTASTTSTATQKTTTSTTTTLTTATSTQVNVQTSSTTTSSTSLSLTTTTTTVYTTPSAGMKIRRAATPVSAPACLNTQSIPASRISSACNCISISTTTVSLVSTAPASTSTSISTASTTSTAITTFTQRIVTTTSTTTLVTVFTTIPTSTTTVSTTTLATFLLSASGINSYVAFATQSAETKAVLRADKSAAVSCSVLSDTQLSCGGLLGYLPTYKSSGNDILTFAAQIPGGSTTTKCSFSGNNQLICQSSRDRFSYYSSTSEGYPILGSYDAGIVYYNNRPVYNLLAVPVSG